MEMPHPHPQLDRKFNVNNSKKREQKWTCNVCLLIFAGKIESYMIKKGIRLTFLIPKDQIEILKPIGKGGYGQVYLGRWLGQDVAVKKYMKKQGFRNRHVGNFIE